MSKLKENRYGIPIFYEREYECPYCNFRAKKPLDALNHYLGTHIKLKPPNCPFCDFIAKTDDEYVNHVDNHPRKLLKELVDNYMKKLRIIRELIKCPFCNFKVKRLEDIGNHIDNTH